ncbi:MAG: PilZ domain-containing protein [Syntrophorhabdales bacterium]|jgi:hypothetical protein
MGSGESERREYFRIRDRLLVEFREVGYEESVVLKEGMRQADLPSEPPAAMLGGGPVSVKDGLYLYLESIDRKLDTIIELLSKTDDLFQGAYLDVTISGSGMRYSSGTRREEGTYLEVRITLPFNSRRRVTALGHVVRSTPSKTENGEGWETAIRFAAMREKDRDTLIGYIFSRERACARTKQMP